MARAWILDVHRHCKVIRKCLEIDRYLGIDTCALLAECVTIYLRSGLSQCVVRFTSVSYLAGPMLTRISTHIGFYIYLSSEIARYGYIYNRIVRGIFITRLDDAACHGVHQNRLSRVCCARLKIDVVVMATRINRAVSWVDSRARPPLKVGAGTSCAARRRY